MVKMGLREKKKERTRKLISDIALDLFIARGYEAVTVAEIAEKSDIAVTTLFNYFPTKESIIFDLGDEIDSDIQNAVRHRKKGESILDCLYAYFHSSKLFNPPSQNKKISSGFSKLIKSTPELSSHLRRLWSRYAETLAHEIKKDLDLTRVESETIAKMLLEGVSYACSTSTPKEALNFTFKVLKSGWNK